MSALDTQIGGSHYKDMAIQPMEFSMANNLDACQHTIIKYVTRFREKGGVQDLEKAKHVIDMLIEFELEDSVDETCGDPGCPQCHPKDDGVYSTSLLDAITKALREEIAKREANGKA